MRKTLGLDSHILLVSSDFLEEYSIFVHLQTKGFCQQIEIVVVASIKIGV